MSEPVYCKYCAYWVWGYLYFNGECDYPENISTKTGDNQLSWYKPDPKPIYHKKPYILNKKNDCKWFRDKRFL